MVFDTQASAFAPWAVAPTAGVRSFSVGRGAEGSARFLFASNQRDRSTFDLYEADAQTRTVREVARSDGSVLEWLLNTDRQLAARVRQLGREDGSARAIELLQPDGQWRTLKTVNAFQTY